MKADQAIICYHCNARKHLVQLTSSIRNPLKLSLVPHMMDRLAFDNFLVAIFVLDCIIPFFNLRLDLNPLIVQSIIFYFENYIMFASYEIMNLISCLIPELLKSDTTTLIIRTNRMK